MLKTKDIFSGFLGGIIGGAVVDLIFINLAGPSALFYLLGIVERKAVFGSHLILGGLLGLLFVLIVKHFQKNIWLLGIGFGMGCLLLIGAIPSLVLGLVSPKTTFFGLLVWALYGLILAAGIKITQRL